MAKKIVITEQTTVEAQPWRWALVANDHDRDDSVPEGTKRLDVVIYFKDDSIPQRKIKDVLAGLTTGRKNHVKNFLIDLADLALESHAAEQNLTTEDDTEDAIE